jgi:hypothetical protein
VQQKVSTMTQHIGHKRYKVTGEVTDPNLGSFRNVVILAWYDDEQLAREFATCPPSNLSRTFGRRHLFDCAQHWADSSYDLGVFVTLDADVLATVERQLDELSTPQLDWTTYHRDEQTGHTMCRADVTGWLQLHVSRSSDGKGWTLRSPIVGLYALASKEQQLALREAEIATARQLRHAYRMIS